ncbi:hypothetical protein [Pontivivens ytuae]|nr:hypothetical protein [Pontivivens ytuae]
MIKLAAMTLIALSLLGCGASNDLGRDLVPAETFSPDPTARND